MIPLFRRFAGAREGAAAVEFAMILPLLCLVLLGTMEVGHLAWMQSTLNFAVQETARCAAISQSDCATPAGAQAYAAQEAYPLDVTANDFAVAQASCGWQVSASVPYSFLLEQVFDAAPTLTARACKS